MPIKLTFCKYQFLQSLFLLNFLALFLSWFFVFTKQLNFYQNLGFFLIFCFIYHYFLNFLHLASHKQLSSNYKFNQFLGHLAAIFGGLTYPDFTVTHFLHHKKPSHPKEDPDLAIANGGSLWTIPFRIWYHDKFFLSNPKYYKNRLLGYFLDRLIQLIFLWVCILQDKFWFWVAFWLLPLFIVGFCNGLFLFYFPHFSTKWETKQRKYLTNLQTKLVLINKKIKEIALNQENQLFKQAKKDKLSKSTQNKNLNFNLKTFFILRVNFYFYSILQILLSLPILVLDISRTYHKEHHDNISKLLNYFPVYAFLKDTIQNNWLHKLENSDKYTNLQY